MRVNLGRVVGAQGERGEKGADGRPIEFNKSTTHIQWRYVGDTAWINLIALSDFQGEQGVPGAKGETGEKGERGDTGATGKSAFQTAVENGYQGTEAEFNAQLAGVGQLGLHASDKTQHTYQYTSTGTSEALAIPLSGSELTDGLSILVKLHTDIADGATLTLDGGLTRRIATSDGKAITAGAIAGSYLPLTYNEALGYWLLTGGGGAGAGTASGVGIPYERTYTAVGGESNVSILGDKITSFVHGMDMLYVYEDNVPIFENDTWTFGIDGLSINFVGRTLTAGQQIHFTVVRWVNTEDVITALTMLEAHMVNTTAHQALFDKKANTTDVDTALAKKANLSDVYSQTEIDSRLTPMIVNIKQYQGVDGNKTYLQFDKTSGEINAQYNKGGFVAFYYQSQWLPLEYSTTSKAIFAGVNNNGVFRWATVNSGAVGYITEDQLATTESVQNAINNAIVSAIGGSY